LNCYYERILDFEKLFGSLFLTKDSAQRGQLELELELELSSFHQLTDAFELS
jgi:hypothetical protein